MGRSATGLFFISSSAPVVSSSKIFCNTGRWCNISAVRRIRGVSWRFSVCSSRWRIQSLLGQEWVKRISMILPWQRLPTIVRNVPWHLVRLERLWPSPSPSRSQLHMCQRICIRPQHVHVCDHAVVGDLRRIDLKRAESLTPILCVSRQRPCYSVSCMNLSDVPSVRRMRLRRAMCMGTWNGIPDCPRTCPSTCLICNSIDCVATGAASSIR